MAEKTIMDMFADMGKHARGDRGQEYLIDSLLGWVHPRVGRSKRAAGST
jgi:hypothetical protein